MKDLAKQMEESQEENEDDQMAEDASNLRMILENLVRLSFDEEDMINNTRQIARNDPRYPELVYRQKEFSGKMKVVEDSLKAIAKRQIMIKPVITKEIAAINPLRAVSMKGVAHIFQPRFHVQAGLRAGFADTRQTSPCQRQIHQAGQMFRQ